MLCCKLATDFRVDLRCGKFCATRLRGVPTEVKMSKRSPRTSFHMHALAASGLFALMACEKDAGSTSTARSSTPTVIASTKTRPAPTASGSTESHTPKLTIQAFEILLGSGDKDVAKLSVDATGAISVEGIKGQKDGAIVGKVTTTGKVTDAAGKKVASLSPDGGIDMIGVDSDVVVAEDGSITQAGTTRLKFGVDGSMTLEAVEGRSQRVNAERAEYKGPKEARRAAALVFATMLARELITSEGKMGDPIRASGGRYGGM